MNYKKLNLPRIPIELKFKIVSQAMKKYNRHTGYTHQFGDYGPTQDNLEEEYGVVLDQDDLDYHEATGSVGFYTANEKHEITLQNHYKNVPELANRKWAVQVVSGGEHVAPHIDPPVRGGPGLLYILKTGGTNVTTSWYKLKDIHQENGVDHSVGIPLKLLDEVESHVLEEDCWHYLNFHEIHGVTNQTGVRLALWAYPNV
jgi:hypothetical protein